MRLRVLLGLTFLVAAAVIAPLTLSAGPAALAVLLLLVVVLQRSFSGTLSQELRGRLGFMVALGLLVFGFVIFQRVQQILTK